MKVAVIPARGGSKRIPRKNLKLFCGKPIIAWSIETALKSGCFDSVIVSTDDAEIADVARKWGAEAPFIRPAHLADDYTATLPVVCHAIEWFRDHEQLPTHVCCIYPTAPLLQSSSLSNAYELLVQSGKLFCFGAASFGHPIQRALRIGSDGVVSMFDPSRAMVRSQDLEPAFHDSGQFCWGTTAAFLEGISPMLQPSVAIILPRERVVDIDTLEDWQLAEALHATLISKDS